MSEPKPGEPWAYLAHKDGRFCGVTAANLPKRELGKFLGDFAASGCAIITVGNRDEYNAELAKLKPWGAP